MEFADESSRNLISDKRRELSIREINDENNYRAWLNEISPRDFIVINEKIDSTWRSFLKGFRMVKAGGGIVRNNNNQLLSIYRNGKWDLPKGKLELGESIRSCSIREVEEETGLSISRCNEGSMATTCHVYFHKETFVLKPTYWFFMYSNDTVLKPQAEEGIEKVEWLTRNEIQSIFIRNTYRSIKDLLLKID